MINTLLRRTLKDLLENRFLSIVSVITIAFSILIATAFALFFVNAGDMLNIWQKGLRMMVYLQPGTSEALRMETRHRLQGISGVEAVEFISSEDALGRLKAQMKKHVSLLENLKSNPLPDAFEILLAPSARTSTELQFLAERIAGLPGVSEVEYGRQWIQRFSGIVNLFSIAGYAIGAAFFMATIFVVANTIRLVLYARREEIEIMRLVGATDAFIKIPFYLAGMIQGGAGTLLGLAVLYGGFFALTSHVQENFSNSILSLRFFPPTACLGILMGGILVGWLGCLLSLKQFMRG